jgi:hypothetical protein
MFFSAVLLFAAVANAFGYWRRGSCPRRLEIILHGLRPLLKVAGLFKERPKAAR